MVKLLPGPERSAAPGATRRGPGLEGPRGDAWEALLANEHGFEMAGLALLDIHGALERRVAL